MARKLNLPLTHELRALREKQDRFEADRICNAILEGYHDLMSGRTVEYRGDLRALLKKKSR